MLDLEKFVFDENVDPARVAIMLAMTQNKDMEKEMIKKYREAGINCAVSMLSGNDVEGRPKATRCVVGLCLNEGLIEKKPQHIHPVVHATWEAAETSRIVDSTLGQNFCVKVAAVRHGCWFALCFYGNMGIHEISTHKTVGLGMQIISD